MIWLVHQGCGIWEQSKPSQMPIPFHGNIPSLISSCLWNFCLQYSACIPNPQIAFGKAFLLSVLISVFVAMLQWSLHHPRGSTQWRSQKGMGLLPHTQAPISGDRPSHLMNAFMMTLTMLLLLLSSSLWTACLSCTTKMNKFCDMLWVIPSAQSVVRMNWKYLFSSFVSNEEQASVIL